MNENELSKASAWVSDEAEAQNLIYALSEGITTAEIPDGLGGTVTNKWEEVYRSGFEKWVTYSPALRSNVQGYYTHTDEQQYPVYKLPDYTELLFRDGLPAVDDDGFLHEVEQVYYKDEGTVHEHWYGNYQTGRKIQVKKFSYIDGEGTEIFLSVPGLLVTVVPDLSHPDGIRCYAIKQIQTKFDGSKEEVDDWNEYEIITEVPNDWGYAIALVEDSRYYWEYTRRYYYGWSTLVTNYKSPVNDIYKFSERYYVADPVHSVSPKVVVKATPDVPEGLPVRDYFVLLEQPIGDYNYINVCHGVGFSGVGSEGDPTVTYVDICDPGTIKPGMTPTIIDQVKAQEVYEKWEAGVIAYSPPALAWEIDYDEVTEIVSPPAHLFHGRNSTITWLPNKKRRPDYLVGFYMAVNNDRVALVIEGDPSPGIHDYYRSFAYIGKMVPFNEYDHYGNFGITAGMGDLDSAKTGIVANDIREDRNPVYAGYGEYTSNGMYSMSLLRTRSNVLFQSYYPAFITQLPNYPNVGSIPSQLSKLILDEDGFQASKWTGRYHASPIYMVHKAEGYRGYLDGVVAIHDQNLVNLDELLVDTEIPKDPNDPSKGNWIEVYKFFSIKSPVNLFKFSASPDVVTVAILKEIK